MKLFTLLSLSLCLFVNSFAAGTPGLTYNYYEGTWSNLPNFGSLTAVKKGTAANVSLDPRNKEMQYAFQWNGFITIPAAGTYTFETYSDDGSSLTIGSTVVVNNDGEHASQFVTGTIALNAGVYPVSIAYFQSYGGQTMETWWSSNSGISRQKIADNAFTIDNPATATTPAPATTTTTTTTTDLRGIHNYYFSATSGDDSYSATQAQDPATPWKTLKKLNSIMSSLQPGDAVLFNRGETFTGNIVVSRSGTASAPIIFSAYGSGSRPVINGLSTLKTWTAVGNGAWETPLAGGDYLNMVLVNGLVQGMGRFPNLSAPNRGYLTVDAHSGNSQITDNDLTSQSSVNWTGAEIVVRKRDWVLDRGLITSQSGNTLNFVSPTIHIPTNGYGYFIQNSPATLDQVGEWYYNPATKKLRMYFGSANPADYSIKASSVDTMVYINNKSYLTFDNISFRGADVTAFQINSSNNINIQNGEINYTGLDGVSAENSPYITIQNNLVNHSNNSGIRLYQGSSYATVTGNAVRNSGLIPGMGSSNNQEHDGIFVDATPYTNISLNTVDSSGYCGITFTGDYASVTNNVVNYFCLTVNDGGGIYTWGGWDKVGRKVSGNIVLNGMGAPAGTNSPIPGGAVGVYTDDRSTNIDITGNTAFNCAGSGIYLHNSHEINVAGNTLYNNGKQLSMVHDNLEPGDPIRNITTQNNILSSSKGTQFLVENSSILNDIPNFGSYNSNYYMRPTDQSGIITAGATDNGQYNTAFYDLAGWRSTYGFDQQSAGSPLTIPTYTVTKLIGNNKFSNGSFNSNVDGVFVMSSPGRGTASFSNGGKLDGGALQVSFDAAGGPSNKVSTYIDFGSITAGKTYVIKFSLQGSAAGKSVKAFILQNGGSYGQLSDLKYFSLTNSRTENQFIFTAPSTQTNAMLALEVNGSDCPFWMDNLQVYEAEVAAINADDYMRFEYNGTTKSKTVTLSGNYVDAKNKVYSGSVVIAPFSSVVLIKQSTVTTASQAATATTASLSATREVAAEEVIATTVKVSPNPAREQLQVAVSLPSNTQAASMSIYTLGGVRLKTIAMSASATNVPVDISTLNSGVYIININYDGHTITKKFVKQS